MSATTSVPGQRGLRKLQSICRLAGIIDVESRIADIPNQHGSSLCGRRARLDQLGLLAREL